MSSMRRDQRRNVGLLAVLASLVLLVAGAGIASANSIPHSGDQLNLFVPPATMPADTQFWAGHGFSTVSPELPSIVANDGSSFALSVDGVAVAMRRDVEFGGGAAAPSVAIIWYHDFVAGLPAGTHHFEGTWYVDGELFLYREIDVLFE